MISADLLVFAKVIHTEHCNHVLESRNWVILETSLNQPYVYYVVDASEVFGNFPQYIQLANSAAFGTQFRRWTLLKGYVETINTESGARFDIQEPDTRLDGLIDLRR